MPASGTDIVYVLSGGSFNTDPNESLGGNPSNEVISSGLNNLFSNISESEAASGKTDFRCIYVFNQNAVDSLFNVQVGINTEVSGGSDIQIGILFATEKQSIVVTNLVTGGSFTIAYEMQNLIVSYDPDLAIWANNLKNALNTISDFDNGVSVQTIQTANQISFNISFEGAGDGKGYSLLTLVSNGLTGLSPTIAISRVQNGSPVNSIPDLLDGPTVIPNGVVFDTIPISIGTLKATEGFPLWIRRETDAGVSPLSNDGFSLKITANPF